MPTQFICLSICVLIDSMWVGDFDVSVPLAMNLYVVIRRIITHDHPVGGPLAPLLGPPITFDRIP